jgi:hypothetical protein
MAEIISPEKFDPGVVKLSAMGVFTVSKEARI